MKEMQISKRFLTFLFCLFAALLSVAAPVLAASAPEKNGGEMLTVGVPANRCPVFYRDAETNEITGIGVDLMRYAAEKSGYIVTFRPIEEKSLKEALDNKAYDVVMPFGSVISGAWGHPAIVSDSFFPWNSG